MAHSYHHAVSSSRRFGGKPEDYLAIHDFLDSTKQCWADLRHRAILHNPFGIFLCEKLFGSVVTNAEGKQVPVRLIAEQHVREDCDGKIPTIQDWLDGMPVKRWLATGARRLSQELEQQQECFK